MIERWLREHLERSGLWNADRVSRKASSTRCRRCGRMLLVGLDADRCAGVARVDPSPLSRQGEMVAKLLGLATYSLRWTINSLELDYRHQWAIRLSPAGTEPYDVVAEHACEIRSLPGALSVHTNSRETDLSGEPPF